MNERIFISLIYAVVICGLGVINPNAYAQDESEQPISSPDSSSGDAELAKKLANPIASLISVPIQMDYDQDIGPTEEGSVLKITLLPVVPFSINDDWNLISRTIVPFIFQGDIPVNGSGEDGLGDIVQSLFFSPQEPTSKGIIWGVGPVMLLPTATDDALGAEKWGIGPTAVALKQSGPWTFGALFNHIQSFAGEGNRADVSATYFQPGVAYITKTRTTITLNTESTYDWKAGQWSVPINLSVAQMLRIGKQPIQIGGGVRYWAESSDNGPEGWGARLQLTLLFPR